MSRRLSKRTPGYPVETVISGISQIDYLTSGSVTPITGSTWDISGTVTALQGTSPWTVNGTVTSTPSGTQDVDIVAQSLSKLNVGITDTTSTVNAVLKTDNIGLMKSTGGTVTALQGTSPWTVDGTVTSTPSGTQDISMVGFTNVATSTVTMSSTNTPYLLPGTEMSGRRTLIVYNPSTADVFIGSSSVTTTSGIQLPANGKLSIDCQSGLYAVASTAITLNVLELK